VNAFLVLRNRISEVGECGMFYTVKDTYVSWDTFNYIAREGTWMN